jgi:calcineurin-like phosphoesterase family protein
MRPPIDWLITDTHWFHDRMEILCERPPDFTARIITNLRAQIQPNDRLFHLGDVIFYKYGYLKSILDSIKGTKILIMGNHDRKSPNWFMNNGFTFATDMVVVRDVLLSHKPVQALPTGVRLNVHGHWHNDVKERPDWWLPATHRLLALEYVDYQPVKLLEFCK